MIKKLIKYITNSDYRFMVNVKLGFHNYMNDEKFIRKIFKIKMGYNLDLNNPKTFNEKLQWLKLYSRDPIFSKMVDKNAVKEFVRDKLGDEYIIPTLSMWNTTKDIDFNSLPNQFVLKCTHDSGGIVICKDKSKLNIKKTRKKLDKFLKRNYYSIWREWPYKNVPHRIIAEKYMEDNETGDIRDYKFFTFSGKVKALFIASDRQDPNKETKFDFFDENFNHLDIRNGHPNSTDYPRKPLNFELMKKFAENLSEGTPHLRVDFYEINGKVYFGEMTFFHNGGFVPFEPKKWDEVFGEWITLPKLDNKYKKI